MSFKLKILSLAAIAIVLASCFREEEFEAEPWSPEFKTPLVKSTFSLADLTNLQDVAFSVAVRSEDLNPLWNGPTIVPPISGLSTEANPDVFTLTDYFENLSTDSLDMTVEFTNDFPIDFGKGTELVFRNEKSQTIFFSHKLAYDVEPGEKYDFEIEVYSEPGEEPPTVESNLEFYLNDFRTNGSDGQVVDFTDAVTTMTFTLDFISVKTVEVLSDREWIDTLNTSFSLTDSGGVEQQRIAEGALTLILNNGLPFNGLAQVDFLDENDQVVDVLFEDTLKIVPSTIDQNNGDLLETTKTVATIPLPFDKLDRLYDDVKLKIIYNLNTNGLGNGGTILVSDQSQIDVKLTADLKFYVDNFELN